MTLTPQLTAVKQTSWLLIPLQSRTTGARYSGRMRSGQLTSAGLASRRRLLDAATAEFAEHGIAGARVDRVCAVAGVNKAQLYAYFGNKERLFDAVLHEHVEMIVDTVPLDAADLPAYALGLYDTCLDHPELVRLATWARLERTPAGALFPGEEGAADVVKREAIQAAQERGKLTSALSPTDVLSLLTSLALAWSPASPMIAASRKDGAAEHARRRSALRHAVEHAFRP